MKYLKKVKHFGEYEMTGKNFIKLVTHKRIPLSCIALKLNCKLQTLRALEKQEKVPYAYIVKFIHAFKSSLSEKEVYALKH